MALKWKKDGTAECAWLRIQIFKHGRNWVLDIDGYNVWSEFSQQDAKQAAENWLREQAHKMLKDLGE